MSIWIGSARLASKKSASPAPMKGQILNVEIDGLLPTIVSKVKYNGSHVLYCFKKFWSRLPSP